MQNSLLEILKNKYSQCGLIVSSLVNEAERDDYEACSFRLNEATVQFRTAKITPKKVGQFVAIWKRSKEGITQPYDSSDVLNFLVIAVKYENRFGHFVFPKLVLLEKDIISLNSKGGKRGMRVYPSWDKTINKQAQNTQNWQLQYFVEVQSDSSIDCNCIKKLYLNK